MAFGFSIKDKLQDMVDSIVDAVKAETAADPVDTLLEHSPSIIGRAEAVIDQLLERLQEDYESTIFPIGSVNYGLLITHRQEWSPITYQVGRLAATIPLAPNQKEEIKVRKTRKVHELRKSVRTQSRESTRESSFSRRLEAEAIEAASTALNNQISSNGSFNIGVGSIGAATQFSANLTQETRRVQKSFSEMAQKAVDSLKEQVEVTVESTTDTEEEMTSTTTLENPNDELTVTYLLYELERRYRVLTEINRVRPVVLVGLEMPKPNEIDEEWLIRHSWIIRDVLLDPTLESVLTDLETVNSSLALEHEVRRAALIEQRQATTTLLREFKALENVAELHRENIVSLMRGEGEIEASEMGTGQRIATAILTAGISELFGGGQSNQDELFEARRKATEKALEWLEQEIRQKATALESAKNALQDAIDAFSEAASDVADHKLGVVRLRVHVRDNIYHYMHAIWAAEHPDNRYFRLYDDLVPFHTPDPNDYTLAADNTVNPLSNLPYIADGLAPFKLTIKAPDTSQAPTTERLLSEIADIDRPLGFRGNLAVFELRECSQLTDYMAAEYIDPIGGVAAPGALAGISVDEFSEYLSAAAQSGVLTQQQLNGLVQLAVVMLTRETDNADELTLPTGQLFMEALPGDTSLLEPFKLEHRGLDVVSVEEDVRAKRIDALRRVSRLRSGEFERDPVQVEHFHLGEPRDIPHVTDDEGGDS